MFGLPPAGFAIRARFHNTDAQLDVEKRDVAVSGRLPEVDGRPLATECRTRPTLTSPRPEGRGFSRSPGRVPASPTTACVRFRARRSDTVSTGEHRQPGGTNVAGRVDVAVVARPAAARPLPHVQRQAVAGRPRTPNTPSTTGTSGRRRPGRGRTTGTCTPACPAAPASAASEMARARRVVAEHVADLQVLDHDRLVLADEPSRQLVQVVAAPVGDPGVHPGDLAGGPSPGSPTRAACGPAPVAPGRAGPGRARSWRGLVTFSPVDRVTSDVTPASTPTTASVGRAVLDGAPRTAGTRASAPPGPRTRSPCWARHPRAAAATSGCPAARSSSPASARRPGSGTRTGCTPPTPATRLLGLERRVLRPLLPEVRERALQVPQALLQRHAATPRTGTPARESRFHSVSIAEVCT